MYFFISIHTTRKSTRSRRDFLPPVPSHYEPRREEPTPTPLSVRPPGRGPCLGEPLNPCPPPHSPYSTGGGLPLVHARRSSHARTRTHAHRLHPRHPQPICVPYYMAIYGTTVSSTAVLGCIPVARSGYTMRNDIKSIINHRSSHALPAPRLHLTHSKVITHPVSFSVALPPLVIGLRGMLLSFASFTS